MCQRAQNGTSAAQPVPFKGGARDGPMTQTHQQASRLHNASDDHAGWRRDVSETSHNCTERIWAHSVHSGNPTCSGIARSATIVTGGDKRFPRPAMIATSGAAAPSMHSGNPTHSDNQKRAATIVTGGDERFPRPAIIAPRAALASSAHSGNPMHSANQKAAKSTEGGEAVPRPAIIATSGASAPSAHSGNPKYSTNKIAVGGDEKVSEAGHDCTGQNGALLHRCIAVTHRTRACVSRGPGEHNSCLPVVKVMSYSLTTSFASRSNLGQTIQPTG